MSLKGYPDQKKIDTGNVQFVTVGPVREQQHGLDVIGHITYQEIGDAAAEAGSTTTRIVATGHAALVGDLISWTSGNLATREVKVKAVGADYIDLVEALAEAPGVGDTFEILRHKAFIVDSSGAIAVAFSGDRDYGTVGPDTLRTAAQIGNATGAADFGVGGAGAQTLRVAVASDQLATLATEATLADVDASLTSLEGKDFATETTLAAAAADLASIAAEDFATQTTLAAAAASLSSIAAEDFATETTLAALAVKDFATETTLAAAASDLNSLANEDFATEATLAAIAADLQDVLVQVSTGPDGRTYADSIRKDYSAGSVTTGAWVELIPSTAADINVLMLFDSSGQTLELGVGGSGAETRICFIPPGGFDGAVPIKIPASSRLAVKAVSASATTGELTITGLT